MGGGLRRPKLRVPGTDLAGQVEAVGRNVSRFQPGDEVFGECVRGHQWQNGGAFAEYAAVPDDQLERKPGNISFEQAAAVPTSALIALQGIRAEGHVAAGQRVVVNGAAGGVGAFAVQIAKAAGAEVTAVDSGPKLEFLRSIGADHVIDYTSQDFTRGGERYDLIVSIPANRSIADLRRALTPRGTYVLIGHDQFGAAGGRVIGGIGDVVKLLVMTPFVSQLKSPFSTTKTEHPLAALSELIEAGQLTPPVDRTYPLSEVLEAMRYMEAGHALGKIVLTI
jgi:NADPH:quinone reductase-like Zn-dependent oxidoreductase